MLIFIHPLDLAKRFKGNGWLANTIGNPLDTTIALSHLIFEGTLDKFPGLKICSAHGGGFLPSYAPRSDNSLRVAPEMDTGIKQSIDHILKAPGFSDADRRKMLGETAAKLLKI